MHSALSPNARTLISQLILDFTNKKGGMECFHANVLCLSLGKFYASLDRVVFWKRDKACNRMISRD